MKNFKVKKIITVLVLGISLFSSVNVYAGPGISSGLDFYNTNKSQCNSVSKQILNSIYSFDSISDTSQGNVIATSYDMTVLVICYANAINISAAHSSSRQAANDLVTNFRAGLRQNF